MVPADLKAFRPDRFTVASVDLSGAHVLLLDDTWTTAGRIQSTSYALKQAGPSRVAAVVLGVM